VHLAIDPGVHTGAVWFQWRSTSDGRSTRVTVLADYFAEGLAAEVNARSILERTRALCGVGVNRLRVSMDPAGSARTAVGPIVRGEYERSGCQGRTGIEHWLHALKADGLQLVEALLKSADGTVSLAIRPRCRHLVLAFQTCTRARRANQWMDYPEDPQHPAEDLIDPLCGGLKCEFPAGRPPPPTFRQIHARKAL
jgi:hypothetical protein